MAADFLKGVTLTTVDEIEASILFALSGGHDSGLPNVSTVKRDLSTGFVALPKNDRGLIERPALNYLAHRYFMKEYGYDVKGLREKTGSNQTVIDGTARAKVGNVPSLIEEFLEKRHAGGFSLHDAAIMVSTLDHVILHEHITLLQAAYQLRGFDDAGRLNMSELDAVISSYRVLYNVGGSLTDPTKHMKLLGLLEKEVETWGEGVTFFTDAVESYRISLRPKSCPFAAPSFSFHDTWRALSEAMRLYGTYEDIECQEMKRTLTDMDPAMSGRVPLGRFWQNTDQFLESTDYLRQLGALDESFAGSSGPQLLISNYVLSSTNCAKETPYYSVCCKNECEILMDQLHDGIAAPTASVDEILTLVQMLPSSTVSVPRNLSEPLVHALSQVSDLHVGKVPLHGRLFAQWMHYAYPHECPYPYTSNTTVVFLNALQFQEQTGMEWRVGSEDAAHHAEKAKIVGTVLPHMSQWTFEEEVRVGASRRTENTAKFTTWIAQVAIVACFSVASWKTVAGMLRSIGQGSTDKRSVVLV